jgi:hypothetical protein
MGMVEAIDGWRDFYGAVANAAAALLGLVFVGMSLHLSLRRASRPVRSLALGSAITLLFPMLVGLMMLIPVGAPHVHGFGAILLALILTVELAWVAHMRVTDRGDTLPWLAYRLGIPLAACIVLFGGGVGMLVGWEPSVAAPAAFVFALFVVGVQDAVDLLLGERGTRALPSFGDQGADAGLIRRRATDVRELRQREAQDHRFAIHLGGGGSRTRSHPTGHPPRG